MTHRNLQLYKLHISIYMYIYTCVYIYIYVSTFTQNNFIAITPNKAGD